MASCGTVRYGTPDRIMGFVVFFPSYSCLVGHQAIGELEKVLEVGRTHVNVLYTFRSVSRAIPMVSGSTDPNKNALHMNTFKVGGLLLLLSCCTSHFLDIMARKFRTTIDYSITALSSNVARASKGLLLVVH